MSDERTKYLSELKNQVQEKTTLLEKTKAELLSQIHEIIEKKPNAFVRYVCELVLGEEEWAKEYRERTTFSGSPMDYGYTTKLYSYLARQILNTLEGERERLEGNVLLSEYIENHILWDHYHSPEQYQSIEFSRMANTFFEDYKSSFQSQITYTSHLVYYGLPLYESKEAGDGLQLVDEADEEHVFLKYLGKEYLGVDYYSMPTWAEKYYINMDHVHWLERMNDDKIKTEDEIAILRTAYRRAIGVPICNQIKSAYGSTSSLFKILYKVIERYYGTNFDAEDSDTWPRQANIVEWLQSEFKLSRREAEAIDIVSRPDRARNK